MVQMSLRFVVDRQDYGEILDGTVVDWIVISLSKSETYSKLPKEMVQYIQSS